MSRFWGDLLIWCAYGVVMACVIAFLVCHSPRTAHAGELVPEFGVEARTGGKVLGLAWSDDLRDGPVFYELAAGTYHARNLFSSPPGVFLSASLGVEAATEGGAYLRAAFGPAYVSRESVGLRGPLQFRLAVGAGLVDPKRGTRVGLAYRHLSNGGMTSPNPGANFLGLEVGVRF